MATTFLHVALGAVLLLQEAMFGVQANRGQIEHSVFRVRWVTWLSRHLRPLQLREEAKAIHRYVLIIISSIKSNFSHVPFIIFIVARCDGCLTVIHPSTPYRHPVAHVITTRD